MGNVLNPATKDRKSDIRIRPVYSELKIGNFVYRRWFADDEAIQYLERDTIIEDPEGDGEGVLKSEKVFASWINKDSASLEQTGTELDPDKWIPINTSWA